MYAPGSKVNAYWSGTNPGYYPATVQSTGPNGTVTVVYDQFPQWGACATTTSQLQPLATQPQPTVVVQQPQPAVVMQQPQQAVVMQQPAQPQTQTIIVQKARKEKYCGPISFLICLFTGFCCIAACPIDERDA